MDQSIKDIEKVIVASSTDLIAVLDRDFNYLAANPAYLTATGRFRDELIGHSAMEVFGRDVFEEVVKPNGLKSMEGEEVRYRRWLKFLGEGQAFYEVSYNPFISANGSILGFIVNGRNITEQRAAEEALLASEAQLAGILRVASEAIIVVDESEIIRLFNQGAVAVFGYKPDEIIGQPLDTLFPPAYHANHHQDFVKFSEKKSLHGRWENAAPLSVCEKTGANSPRQRPFRALSPKTASRSPPCCGISPAKLKSSRRFYGPKSMLSMQTERNQNFLPTPATNCARR